MGLTPRESFKIADLESAFNLLNARASDLIKPDKNIPDNIEQFKIANAVDWSTHINGKLLGYDVTKKSIEIFVGGMRTKIEEYRRSAKIVYIVEPLVVFADNSSDLKTKKRKGIYGWMKLGVKE